jgi:hypothetical protein
MSGTKAANKSGGTKRKAGGSAGSYEAVKEHEGKRYVGMQVGRSHRWNYDAGEWKETKRTPDLWEVEYSVKKRRAAKAPEGSGVPVGTGYHWAIFAHQMVEKLDANVYDTKMTGLKFKVAHKRAAKDGWSASPEAQRKRLIGFLESILQDLKKGGSGSAAGITSAVKAEQASDEEEKPGGQKLLTKYFAAGQGATPPA